MSDEHIKVAEDDGIVTITLNRPERLNAFVGHMRRDLAEALEEAGSDPHVRVVIVTGAGRAFCAGGDVNFMAELVERSDTEEFARLLGAARRVILAIRQMTKPVIASINGPASGAGFNLALACDLRIASSRRDLQPIVRQDRLSSRLGRHLFSAAHGTVKHRLRDVFPGRRNRRAERPSNSAW